MLHLLLLSVFCDKIWDFLRGIQYAGFVVLLIGVCGTELHLYEMQNYVYKTLTGI
jgi:hypothetical protein